MLSLLLLAAFFQNIESTKEGIHGSIRFPLSFQSAQKALIGGTFISAATIAATAISKKIYSIFNDRFYYT